MLTVKRFILSEDYNYETINQGVILKKSSVQYPCEQQQKFNLEFIANFPLNKACTKNESKEGTHFF